MKMTFRVIVFGGVIVFFAVLAVVVFIPSLIWNPPQTTIAYGASSSGCGKVSLSSVSSLEVGS